MKWIVCCLMMVVAGCGLGQTGTQPAPAGGAVQEAAKPVVVRFKTGQPAHPYPLLADPAAVAGYDTITLPKIAGVVTVTNGGAVSTTLTIPLADGEAIWGGGERFDSINLRGTALETWVIEPWGKPHSSYFSVPFYISSQGYGLFINCSGRVKFDGGVTKPDEWRITVPENGLDVFVFKGTPREIVQQYTALVGRPQPVPDWVFQPWISRNSYLSEYEVDRVIDKMDEYKLKAGGVVLEGWASGLQNFTFEEHRYPDPPAWIARLHAHGYHVLVWETPSLWDSASTYPEAKKKGYLVLNPDGTELRIDWLENAVKIDFRKLAARAWWTKLHEPLIEMGVDGFKTDGGERAPDPWFHNLHTYYYQRAVLDAFTALGKTGGVTFARSADASCAGNTGFWGGDQNSVWNDFPKVVRAGVTAGLSGFALWGHDVGGYSGTPTKKLYVRWLELGAFSPIMQLHGTTPREPWFYDDETLRIAKFYFDLRAAMQPYLLAAARQAYADGTPIMRPLIWGFPDDRAVWGIDDEYLFGDDFLVAPVLSEMDERKIYLPAGDWVDAWTKDVHHGPETFTYRAKLEALPLFVRQSALADVEKWLPPPLQDDRGDVVVDLAGATNERGVVPAQRVVQGQRYEKIFLTVRNRGGVDLPGVVRLSLPGQLSVEPTDTQKVTVPAQGEARVAFYVSWPETLPVGSYSIGTVAEVGPSPVAGPTVTLVKLPEWHVLGLFPGGVGSGNVLDGVAPDLTAHYTGRGGRDVQWQKAGQDAIEANGAVDFGKVVGGGGGSTCYGYTTITAADAGHAQFLVGSGDALTIALNGKQVFQKLVHRAALPDEDAVDVDLRQGTNTVVVKISRDLGPNLLYFRVAPGQSN